MGWWTGKRLAYLWETGWDDASFRRKLGDSYLFYYKSNRKEYTHQLGLADYGEEKTWVAYARDRA